MANAGPDWTEGRIDLDGVTIRYRRKGGGPPVVFVHGVYVGGTLWNAVAGLLDDLCCIVPTWPLGGHRDPAPGADLSARATARRIPELLEALDLSDVTLVGNDTGGGICLAALATGHTGLQRIGRLVLTNCDSYEHFPPKGFDRIAWLARRVPPVVALMLRGFASAPGQRFFLKSVCIRPPAGPQATAIFEAFATSPASRHDALLVTQSLEPSVTLEAVEALRAFPKPVLLAWGDSDKLFPLDHAHRLQSDFRDARLEVIPDASTFVMLDQPAALAHSIRAFASST